MTETIWIMVLTAVCIVLLGAVLILYTQVNKLKKKYEFFMKDESGQSIERRLSTEVKELREMSATMGELMAVQRQIQLTQDQCVQKIGFVKYNAFDNIGSNLSFSLTVLDGKNNGYCLSSVYGRNESRIFAKPIIQGKCMYSLSMEEMESLESALSDRSNEEILKSVRNA